MGLHVDRACTLGRDGTPSSESTLELLPIYFQSPGRAGVRDRARASPPLCFLDARCVHLLGDVAQNVDHAGERQVPCVGDHGYVIPSSFGH